MRVFEAAEPTEGERPSEQFKLAGEIYTAYKPKMAAVLDVATIMEIPQESWGLAEFHICMEFIRDTLDVESAEDIQARCRDPKDKLDVFDLLPTLSWLLEWAGKDRGTSQPASPPSRKRSGRTSTAGSRRKAAPTSGPSRRTVSST